MRIRSLACVSVVGLAPALVAACSGADTQDVLVNQAAAGSPAGTGAPSCGAPETEPNDTAARANTLDTTRCGTVNSASDPVDYLTFELRANTASMSLNFTGSVRLRVTVGGQTVTLTPDGSGSVPLVRGKPYLVAITPLMDTGADVPWTVTLVVN
jgi:hypothetical protein